MAATRINITIQEELLHDIDTRAEYYGTNRSKLIATVFEMMDNMNAWQVLENSAIDSYDDLTAWNLTKASKECRVTRK